MAQKVNKKFVVALCLGGVALLLVGVGLLRLSDGRSADRLATLGDAALARGDLKAAERFFSQAVNKGRMTNAEHLRRWREVLLLTTPEDRLQYETRYRDHYLGILRQLAVVERTDVAAHEEFLSTLMRQLVDVPFSRGNWDELARQAGVSLANFTGQAPGPWERLRRYRGLARVQVLANGGEVRPEELEEARGDLEAALRVEPGDAESTQALAVWHFARAERLRREEKGQEADEAAEAARRLVAEFAAAFPRDIAGQVALARQEIERVRRELVTPQGGTLRGREFVEAYTARLGPARERLDGIVALFADPAARDATLLNLGRFRQAELLVEPQGRSPRTRAVVAGLIARDADNPDWHNQMASLHLEAEELPEALAVFDHIQRMPLPPVSERGMRLVMLKAQSAALAALTSGRRLLGAPDEQRAALLEDARRRRDFMVEQLGNDVPARQLADAYIAAGQGDWATAKPALEAYNRQTSENDPEALLLLARAHLLTNEPGAAERRAARVLALQPGNLRAMLLLADVQLALRRYDEALANYQQVLEADPDNEALRTRIREVRVASGAEQSEDPVARVLAEAQRALDGEPAQGNDPGRPGDPDAALAILERALAASPGEARLVQAVAGEHYRRGDRDRALAVARAGLQSSPDDRALKQLITFIEIPDRDEALAAIVSASEMPPLEKAVQAANIYLRSASPGAVEKAFPLIDEAARLAPNDPRVIELQFIRAMARQDDAEMKRIADRAVAENTDRVQGKTFLARALVADGKANEAAAMLEQAAGAGALTPEIYRLLSRLQAQAGRTQAASDSLRAALDLRPNDVPTLLDYVTLLASTGRTEEALAAARQSERFAGGDDRFQEVLYNLEALAGDKQKALDGWLSILKRRPRDEDARRAAAGVMIDLKRWEDALKLLNELSASAPDSLEVAALRARWAADQGDFGAARLVLAEHIALLPRERLTADPFVTLGRFMIDRGQTAAGLTALRQALRHDDPKTLNATKVLADTLVSLGRQAEALPYFQRIVSSGADTGDAYRLRAVEALLRLGRLDEADAELRAIPPDESTPVRLLLGADIAGARGDERAQKQQLDRAVTLFPEAPFVYLKRATAFAGRREFDRDVLSDIEAALRRQPNSWQALRVRAAHHIALGRTEQALTDLRAAIRIDPSQDEIRNAVVSELIRLDRPDDAVEVATEAIRARNNDLAVIITTGDLFASAQQWARAAFFYRQAFQQSPAQAVYQRYLDALMSATPPNLPEAEAVLARLADRVEREPGLLMARAWILQGRGRAEDAARDLQNALRRVDAGNPSEVQAWAGQFRRVIPEPQKAIDTLTLLKRGIENPDWLDYLIAMTSAERPEGAEAAVAILRRLSTASSLAPVRAVALRSLGVTLYGMNRFEEAAASMAEGVAAFPQDWELSNNLAFVLARHLNRPKDALPHAERAVELAPSRAETLDTLGVVQMENGLLPEAQQTLRRALEASETVVTRFAVLVHLADATARSSAPDAKAQALRHLDAAKAIMDAAPANAIPRPSVEDYEELRGKIGSP